MVCNSVSYYPFKIDDRIFFQDNSLDNLDIINTYNNLIAQGKYTEASNYINQQKNVYGYFADFFNAIENRIFTLQSFLLTKQKNNPHVYSDVEPEDICNSMIWIEE